MNLVQELNYKAAFESQNGLCCKCKARLRDNPYYILDQSVDPSINEIYCHKCGLEKEK